jgi:predicted Zn-dependent peptidase
LEFHQTQLDNGLTVVAETNPHVYSVAAGFFVRTGSRDETPDVAGVSHFLEHMAFKGTDTHSADDVNRILDDIGARSNASTSEEVTLYYAVVLPEYLPRAFEILAGLIRPALRGEDFDVEKKVILEEIGMYEDQPSFVCYEKAMASHFIGHPLGRSILGTSESITALTAEQMRHYHADHYRAGNVTLAIAGNVDWDDVLDLAKRYCGHWPAGSFDRPTTEANPPGVTRIVTRESSTLQYVMQMAPAPPARNDLRYAADLLAMIVGADVGTRLYWELVDPGLCEAAELGFNEYDGSGTWLTYLAGTPESTRENLARIRAVYEAVNADGVTEEELERARNKVASGIVIRGERPMGRLSSLGSNWVYRGEYRSVEDDLATLQGIAIDDLREMLDVYPLAQTTTVAVGPLSSL